MALSIVNAAVLDMLAKADSFYRTKDGPGYVEVWVSSPFTEEPVTRRLGSIFSEDGHVGEDTTNFVAAAEAAGRLSKEHNWSTIDIVMNHPELLPVGFDCSAMGFTDTESVWQTSVGVCGLDSFACTCIAKMILAAIAMNAGLAEQEQVE
jgi:hypothetical protein